MKKHLITLLITGLVAPVLTSCIDNGFTKEFEWHLSTIDSIRDFKRIDRKDERFKCGYEVYFDMPVDWDNPNGEKFQQRVVIDVRGLGLPTVVELQGYNIPDAYIKQEGLRELPALLGSNFVIIEHRYFDQSSYTKANYEDATGWEELTVENAAKDQNFIIGELKKIFTDKWIATGYSKGGYVTNALACLYPETCDLYVPFVAPCLTQFDSRPSEFLNNEAGNSTYGEEQAKIIRDNLLKFQVFCYEYKNLMIPILLSEQYLPSDCKFREAVTNENLYDITMLDLSYGFWQYGYTTVKTINDFVSMPESTNEEVTYKVNEAINILNSAGSTMTCASYTQYFPYYVTAFKEMGNYTMNFSYVKAMAESLGKTINISIPEGKEIEFFKKSILSEDQIKNFAYNDTMYQKLTHWLDEEIEATVIMINGQEDPWFHGSIPLPEKLPANVKVYTHPTQNHRVQIAHFNSAMQRQIMSCIYEVINS